MTPKTILKLTDLYVPSVAQYICKDSKLLASLVKWYILFLPSWSGAEIKCTGIPRFTLLMWEHIKNNGNQKLSKSRLLSSTKGEDNRI